jgi:hypothetical protein
MDWDILKNRLIGSFSRDENYFYFHVFTKKTAPLLGQIPRIFAVFNRFPQDIRLYPQDFRISGLAIPDSWRSVKGEDCS